MSSSRARTRIAVVAAAVPIMAGAVALPAFAASVTVAPYTSIGANNVVGPNAGFRNVAQGVRGNTAVLTLDVSSSSASLDSVELKLSGFSTGPALVPDRDFAQTDGFSVYKDVSQGAGNTLGGPDGVFGAIDHAQGPVSTGYSVGTPSAGQYPVRIAIDGVRATNSSRYFVTVHPGDPGGSLENRDFVVTMPVDGVRFGDATKSPSEAVSTPRLTIDSKPPAPLSATNFTPQSKLPLERQGDTKVEDAYLVNKNEANDPDKTLVFLNDGNNVATSNFLYRPVPQGADPLPAIAAVPPNGGSVFIGDGTGITNTVKVARNNQTSDDVYVRAFDTIGNLTTAIRLFDNSQASSGDRVDRSNDVKAPVVSATSASLNSRGVNASNVSAVPTRISYTVATANDVRNHDQVAGVEGRMLLSVGGIDATDPANITPWGSAAGSGTNNSARNITVPVNTSGVGTTGSQMRVEGRLFDNLGNTTDIWKSTSTFLKDLITPQVTGASFEVDENNDGKGDPGDKIRVVFSEPMHKPTITETGPSNPCQHEDVPATPGTNAVLTHCVNKVLPFPVGGIWWGSNPTVVWSADLTSVLIEVGPDPSPAEPTPSAPRLPELGDQFRATERVQDPVGNAPVVPTHSDRFISTPPPVPNLATTADTQGVGRNLYNQGRDGYLDKITVTFPVALDNAATTVPANLANFKIIGSDVQTPTAVAVTSSTQFTLSFGGVMGSGETPKVVYTPPASGGLSAGTVPVPAFTASTLDYAPPALQMLVTNDADADGKLDRLVATYSEPIDHATPVVGDNTPYSYRVNGYENQPDGSLECPAPGLLVDPYNSSTAGPTPNVTHIAMCEKAAPDTGVTPTAATVDLQPTDLADHDDGPNTSPTGWSSGSNDTTLAFNRVLDKAPAVAISRTVKDLNSDGRTDAIDIVFGEALDGVTIENAQFIVANRTITSLDRVNGTTIRINLQAIAPGLTGDTDTKPTVQYTGGSDGGLKDASDQRNPVRPDAAPVASTDGAGPAITAACAGTAANNGKCPVDTATDDKMNVFFSEALDPASVQAADFVVEQPTGANKAVTAVAMAADNKSATLTFANNAIDQTKDATVRFPTANAVTDAATPTKIGNAQTAAVVAPAPPAVALNLTCPTPATAGYCGASFVNTGATATAGLVRSWRLATTARTATTPDSEYSTTVPSTYPPAGQILPEGTLTLFLSGKDDFGRISTEVSKTIEILKAPAIETGSVKFVNTSRSASNAWARTDTVMDGDNISVGATVFGTDSDIKQWVGSNGACLAQHMSVDYRGLTNGHATHAAVAPFACPLTATAGRDFRKMEFPFVKATGTTKFPVGTVVRTSSTDPGAIIVDGPNGTQLRRHFISVNARRSHAIADAHVITVPSSLVNGIKRGPGMGYRDGAVIKTSTSGYYYMYQNIKRPISGATLSAWRIPTTSVYVVSPAEFNAHGTGVGLRAGAHALGTWVRFSNGSIHYITKNAQGLVVRRGVASHTALRTLVPSNQIYAATSQDSAIPFDASFIRGYRDGTVLKMGTNSYAVVSRTVLRHFANTRTFFSMGYNTANAQVFSAGSMPKSPAGYATGAPIDRYKISSVIIKVTNKAGAVVTATVLPVHGGVFGVGTLDPIPSGWDPSRA